MKRSPSSANSSSSSTSGWETGISYGRQEFILLILCLLLGVWVQAYVDAPPIQHSGGFGEPTCHQCHSQYPLNDPEGGLIVEGIPESYQGGKRYPMTIRLTSPEMRIAGFQLAVRFLEGAKQGEQAGSLEAVDDRVKITPSVPDGVQYAHHSVVGTRIESQEEAIWQVIWNSPGDTVSGTVIFHAAANAGNGDDSEFGDRVYVGAWTSQSIP